MLLSAGIPLPRSVWAHGFVSVSGERMSKTLGNVIAPQDVVQRFGVDGCRYLFLREVPFDRDGDFSWTNYAERYNADLANDLGNLLARTLAMVQHYWSGAVPPLASAPPDPRGAILLGFLERATAEYQAHVDRLAIHAALAAAWSTIQAANRYIEETKPWELAKNPDSRARLGVVLRHLLDVLRRVSVMIVPAMPSKAEAMRRRSGRLDDRRPELGEIAILVVDGGGGERVGRLHDRRLSLEDLEAERVRARDRRLLGGRERQAGELRL